MLLTWFTCLSVPCLCWALLMRAVSGCTQTGGWGAGVCLNGWVGIGLDGVRARCLGPMLHPSVAGGYTCTPASQRGDPGHSHRTIQRCRCPEGDFREV